MEVVRTHEAVNQLTSMPVVSVSSDGAAQSTFGLNAKQRDPRVVVLRVHFLMNYDNLSFVMRKKRPYSS